MQRAKVEHFGGRAERCEQGQRVWRSTGSSDLIDAFDIFPVADDHFLAGRGMGVSIHAVSCWITRLPSMGLDYLAK